MRFRVLWFQPNHFQWAEIIPHRSSAYSTFGKIACYFCTMQSVAGKRTALATCIWAVITVVLTLAADCEGSVFWMLCGKHARISGFPAPCSSVNQGLQSISFHRRFYKWWGGNTNSLPILTLKMLTYCLAIACIVSGCGTAPFPFALSGGITFSFVQSWAAAYLTLRGRSGIVKPHLNHLLLLPPCKVESYGSIQTWLQLPLLLGVRSGGRKLIEWQSQLLTLQKYFKSRHLLLVQF